jgi:uncharacterized phage protein (TIGR02218 family)
VRDIPAALQTQLDGTGTTLCYLLKITGTDGTSFGVTSLDVDVDYDDGFGEITYSAPIGMDQSALETSSDLKVDNSEALVILADTGPVTPEKIEAGVLDYAKFIVYRVNWKSLVSGEHYIAQTGTTGAVKNRDGLAGVIELRSLSQNLKQTYGKLYSITCRAVFGSTTPTYEACNFNAESLWDAGEVDTVGTETDREFTGLLAPDATGPNGALEFAPGLVEWLTGDNAGDTSEIEEISGAVFTLRFPTWRTIVSGDTYQARPDCAKRFTEDCIGAYDNYLNFRGEPLIPLADESSQVSPGATVGIDLGVYRNQLTPVDTE